MAVYASHPLTPNPSPGTGWRAPVRRVPARRRRDALAEAIDALDARTAAWKASIVACGGVSLAGVLALLLGLGSSGPAEELVTGAASVATGLLGHLAPRPPSSEVLRPARDEAF
jgi:hypothetical protein